MLNQANSGIVSFSNYDEAALKNIILQRLNYGLASIYQVDKISENIIPYFEMFAIGYLCKKVFTFL